MFLIETPRGILTGAVFATKKEAEDYALAVLSWSGTRWRIIPVPETA